jgi:hypothetical protein
MSVKNTNMPSSYIPNVIKTPAVAALNTLKNTAASMGNRVSNVFGSNNKGPNQGASGNMIGNIFSNAGNRLENAGDAIGNAGSAVANKMNNLGTGVANTVLPNSVANAVAESSIPWGIIIALMMLGLIVGLIVYFYEDLKQLVNRLRGDSEPTFMPPPVLEEEKKEAPKPAAKKEPEPAPAQEEEGDFGLDLFG